jgi:N-acetylglucosamine-6-phosphate deacetylase
MNSFTLTNTTVYTGDIVIPDGMISVADGLITYVGPRVEAGTTLDTGDSIDLQGASVTSGFLDVQVNGGGDCLFNDEPTAASLQKIMDAHARFGTTQLLVTYISGSVEGMKDALHAVLDVRRESDNCLGIHYEGPVISQKRLGVHDPTYVRTQFPMELVHKDLCTMVTLAPEVAVPGTIADLVRAGARVAIGHSEATFEQAREAVMEGATGFTHLYNAMSPLTGREPGVVGACFADSNVWGGIIVDGYHCHF